MWHVICVCDDHVTPAQRNEYDHDMSHMTSYMTQSHILIPLSRSDMTITYDIWHGHMSSCMTWYMDLNLNTYEQSP